MTRERLYRAVGVSLIIFGIIAFGLNALAVSLLNRPAQPPFVYDSHTGQVESSGVCMGETLHVRVSGESLNLRSRTTIYQQIVDQNSGVVVARRVDHRPVNAPGDPLAFDFMYPVPLDDFSAPLPAGDYIYQHHTESLVQQEGSRAAEWFLFGFETPFSVVECA